MAWKVVTLLGVAICSLCSARPPYSEQKITIRNHGASNHVGSNAPEHQEKYAWAYPSYEFSYKVLDHHTHDLKGQHEHREGDKVKGTYWLVEPTGRKRVVKYHANKHDGFNAQVGYLDKWEEGQENNEGESENSSQDGGREEEGNGEGNNSQEQNGNEGAQEEEVRVEGEAENNGEGNAEEAGVEVNNNEQEESNSEANGSEEQGNNEENNNEGGNNEENNNEGGNNEENNNSENERNDGGQENERQRKVYNNRQIGENSGRREPGSGKKRIIIWYNRPSISNERRRGNEDSGRENNEENQSTEENERSSRGNQNEGNREENRKEQSRDGEQGSWWGANNRGRERQGAGGRVGVRANIKRGENGRQGNSERNEESGRNEGEGNNEENGQNGGENQGGENENQGGEAGEARNENVKQSEYHIKIYHPKHKSISKNQNRRT